MLMADFPVPSAVPGLHPYIICAKLVQTARIVRGIFLVGCRDPFSGVQSALGSFLCPKPVTSWRSSEHLFGQANPPLWGLVMFWKSVTQQSCETLSSLQATFVVFLCVNSGCTHGDSWTSVFQKPPIRMNSWKFSMRRWSCCLLHTVKHYGISWHIWRGRQAGCKEL